MKEVNNHNLWNFELGSQESMNVPTGIIRAFQKRALQDSQFLINDTFVDYLLLVLNVLSGQKIILMVLF